MILGQTTMQAMKRVHCMKWHKRQLRFFSRRKKCELRTSLEFTRRGRVKKPQIGQRAKDNLFNEKRKTLVGRDQLPSIITPQKLLEKENLDTFLRASIP